MNALEVVGCAFCGELFPDLIALGCHQDVCVAAKREVQKRRWLENFESLRDSARTLLPEGRQDAAP